MKNKASTLIGDTSEAIPDPAPPEFDEGKRVMTRHSHDLCNFNLNPGGAGGQVVQIREAQMAVETPPKKDLIKLGG